MTDRIAHAQPQPWMSGFNLGPATNASASLLSKGVIDLREFGRLTFPPDGEPDWDRSGLHPSLLLWLHSLKWLDRAIQTAPSHPSEERDRVLRILRSWVRWEAGTPDPERHSHAWHGHSTALRTSTLVAAAEAFDDEPWLTHLVQRHADHLKLPEHWDGHWNHGFIESLVLLGAGCHLGDGEAQRVALERIEESVPVLVDDDGCTNEQAPGYASYVHYLLKITNRVLRHNGVATRFDLEAILDKLSIFIAHCHLPSGRIVQLGDSYDEPGGTVSHPAVLYAHSRGAEGTPPDDRVAIYPGGFVLSRSTWGSTAEEFRRSDHVSVRFGPGRIIHGHNDHTSVTWYARGRHLLVDSGHFGYVNGPHRRHLQSVNAHNMITVSGMRYDWSAPTSVLRSSVGDTTFVELEDAPHEGTVRRRSVLHIPDLAVVVFDRVTTRGQRTFDQAWHLDPELELESALDGTARFRSIGSADPATLTLMSFVVTPDQVIPCHEWTYGRGVEAPRRGWVSRREGHVEPSPTVSFRSRGASTAMVTALVVSRPDEVFSSSLRSNSDASLALRLNEGDTTRTIRVSRGGFLAFRG